MSAQTTSSAASPSAVSTPLAVSSPSAVSPQWVLRVAAAIAARPTLWATAIRQVGRLAPPGWWRHRPFLPLPAPDYLAFRSQTMYGGVGQAPEPGDVCVYLQWCRAFPREHRSWITARNPISAQAGER